MAWTEQDLREIEDELKKGSQGVGDVPEAESLDGITSLPAYQEVEGQDMPSIVRAPLTLLAAPALDAADKANAAATKAEENANAAQTAANSANEKAGLAAQAASDANAAKEGAEAATQSANTAASNAEEKAAAANTAAQDAEKVANNPTYIGKDHYVYVYNKKTESFDKTDIYCKGEPGSSFRVAGEYATLEALKSAVPDGSAVDGFMAVGTEAPYDYYAWVNGEWVSQGKIGGIDEAPTDGKAYGRKNKDWVEVLEKSKTVEYKYDLREADLDTFKGSGGDIAFIGIQRNNKFATPENHYPLEEAGTLIVAGTITDKTNQIYHTYNSNRIFIRSATSSGENRDFSDWVEVAKVTDVLTKTNTSSFTPTGDYQPATKKYVDNINYGKVINVSVGTYLVTNKNEKDREAIDLINTIFGSVDNLKEIIQDIIANHTKYYFHSYNSKDNCIELSSIYSFHNPETEEYNLQCNISYYINNGPVSKRMGFKLMPNDEDCAASIEDILTSDNLQRVVKRTKTEYDSIGTKNEYTMYATTDA